MSSMQKFKKPNAKLKGWKILLIWWIRVTIDCVGVTEQLEHKMTIEPPTQNLKKGEGLPLKIRRKIHILVIDLILKRFNIRPVFGLLLSRHLIGWAHDEPHFDWFIAQSCQHQFENQFKQRVKKDLEEDLHLLSDGLNEAEGHRERTMAELELQESNRLQLQKVSHIKWLIFIVIIKDLGANSFFGKSVFEYSDFRVIDFSGYQIFESLTFRI